MAARSPSGGVALLGRRAEVQARRELAQDQAVHALEELRLERARADELGEDGDRPQVRVQAQAAAQREEGLLRAHGGVRVVPLRPADRTQEHGIGGTAGLDVLGPAGDAVRIDAGAAHDEAVPLEAEAEAAAGGLEDAHRALDDLGADAVARDQRDPVRRPCRVRPGAATLRHGRSSTSRLPTNATSTPLISAPCSLLAATRYASRRRLDDVRGQAVTGHHQRTRTLVGRAPGADEDLALRVAVAGDGLDLVVGQDREPAEDRLHRLVHRLVEGVDGAVARGASPPWPRPATIRLTEPTLWPPDAELDAPAEHLDGARHVGRLLLHERQRGRRR